MNPLDVGGGGGVAAVIGGIWWVLPYALLIHSLTRLFVRSLAKQNTVINHIECIHGFCCVLQYTVQYHVLLLFLPKRGEKGKEREFRKIFLPSNLCQSFVVINEKRRLFQSILWLHFQINKKKMFHTSKHRHSFLQHNIK